jgi:tetratricopeptide (TPR) repeat protein
MVANSVRAKNPPIGFQLTERYKPRLIAALCEAQNLPVDSERYENLTKDVAGVRMRLLSGLLRTADILEESRRRASIAQARTLLLDLTSQTHWWRHYYVENITFEQNQRLVTIWFDFPADRRAEYASVVPEIQMPWIENEFGYHAPIFNRYGFGWSLTQAVAQTPYSDAAEMPDSVLGEMWKQVRQKKEKDAKDARQNSLAHFRRSIPFFDRRISDLEAKKGQIDAGEYLSETAGISQDLWDIGARRGATELLSGAYTDEAISIIEGSESVKIAVRFAMMSYEEREPRRAATILNGSKSAADELSDNDENKFLFWQAFAQVLAALCSYDEAINAFERALQMAPHDEYRSDLSARIAEFQLLYGDINSLIS